ncbi:MAG: GNAT family N-acetyltransferase [Flavobacteriales bacterium]
MNLQVRIVEPAACKPLRHLVLWPHIADEKDCVIDLDHNEGAIHLGTFDSGLLVSIGSLFQQSTPKLNTSNQYRLRAMATHPDYRGKHCGALLISEAIQLLKQKNVQVLWCDARLNAIGFYTSMGFQLLDEPYEVPCIGPHKFMWIDL